MLNVKDLGFSYKTAGQDQPRFVNNIDIELNAGEILGVISRNQDSKKPFVDCLTLSAKPNSGSITLGHQNLSVLNGSALRGIRAQIGFANSSDTLINSKTGFENLVFPLRVKGLDEHEIRHIAEPLAQYFNLQNLHQRYPNDLSVFEKRKLCIARALINRPRLLVLDEVTHNLDMKSYQAIARILKQTKRDFEHSIILFTKDLELIKALCTNVAVLQGDQLINEGSVAQFFVNPKHLCSKELVKTYARTELPWGVRSKLRKQHESDTKAIVRSAFIDALAPEILLNQIISEFGVKVNIINSYSELIQNYGCHFSYIEMHGTSEAIESSIQLLNQNRLYTEVLGYAT